MEWHINFKTDFLGFRAVVDALDLYRKSILSKLDDSDQSKLLDTLQEVNSKIRRCDVTYAKDAVKECGMDEETDQAIMDIVNATDLLKNRIKEYRSHSKVKEAVVEFMLKKEKDFSKVQQIILNLKEDIKTFERNVADLNR